MPRFGGLALLLFLSVTVVFVSRGASDPPPEKRMTHQMMREKLSLAQNLLHAVAVEDYAKMESDAKSLAQLTRDAAWQAYRTDQYRMESVEFERAAYQLAAAARAEKHGETTLGFLGVTLSCIRCHRYLREADEIESRELSIPEVAKLPAEEEAKNLWMKKKLELSEAILAGLALGDAESIEKNAEIMQTLSSIEGWARRKDVKEYREYLDSFRSANKELISSAAKGDLDNSALAFTQVMLNCVKCHRHLRAE